MKDIREIVRVKYLQGRENSQLETFLYWLTKKSVNDTFHPGNRILSDLRFGFVKIWDWTDFFYMDLCIDYIPSLYRLSSSQWDYRISSKVLEEIWSTWSHLVVRLKIYEQQKKKSSRQGREILQLDTLVYWLIEFKSVYNTNYPEIQDNFTILISILCKYKILHIIFTKFMSYDSKQVTALTGTDGVRYVFIVGRWFEGISSSFFDP